MAEKAPSTAPATPLEESYARILGINPTSAETGTSPINYGDANFRAAPASDVITIQGDPGTGATTAETWSHDIALENQRREQLEFQYEQQQAEIANQLKAQESARAEAQLGLSKATSAREAAAEARLAALAPYQLESARTANRQAAAEASMKERQWEDLVRARNVENAVNEQARWQGSYAISPESSNAYMAATNAADNRTFQQRQGGGGQMAYAGGNQPYQYGVSTYQPKPGTWDYFSRMRDPNRGQVRY